MHFHFLFVDFVLRWNLCSLPEVSEVVVINLRYCQVFPTQIEQLRKGADLTSHKSRADPGFFLGSVGGGAPLRNGM